MGLEMDNHKINMAIRKVTMKYDRSDYIRDSRLAKESQLRKVDGTVEL
jgi:hypothetical protein